MVLPCNEIFPILRRESSLHGHSFLFLVRPTTNIKSLSFQIHLLKMRHKIQMTVVMLQAIPSFFTGYSEKYLFIPSNTYKKYIVCNNNCVAFHNDKTCFVSNCKFHILPLGNVEELLEKLDTFCFTSQHVDCVYTLSSIDSVERLLQRVDKFLITCNEQLTLITETREWTEWTSIAKNRLLRKKFIKPLFSSFKKTKTTQTSGSVFEKRIENVKKTNF